MVPSEDAPWEPPELALRVGDRVVVNTSECVGYPSMCDRPAQHFGPPNGSIGIVVGTDWPHALGPHMTHRYQVQFPTIPHPDVRGEGFVAVFARSELRRLAAPDPRAGDGDTQAP